MALRDLALTVLELEPHEFHWVVMEAVQAESEDCLGYRPVDSSLEGASDYTEALIRGTAALRALQGLAPLSAPAGARSGSSPSDSVPDSGFDSCLLTTAHPAL